MTRPLPTLFAAAALTGLTACGGTWHDGVETVSAAATDPCNGKGALIESVVARAPKELKVGFSGHHRFETTRHTCLVVENLPRGPEGQSRIALTREYRYWPSGTD